MVTWPFFIRGTTNGTTFWDKRSRLIIQGLVVVWTKYGSFWRSFRSTKLLTHGRKPTDLPIIFQRWIMLEVMPFTKPTINSINIIPYMAKSSILKSFTIIYKGKNNLKKKKSHNRTPRKCLFRFQMYQNVENCV